MTTRPDPLHILTVCGVGMGTSLMLKMTVEDSLRQLDVPARVECTDLSTARGMAPDVVLAQEMHATEIADLAPIVIVVDDFLDRDAVTAALRDRFREKGWVA